MNDPKNAYRLRNAWRLIAPPIVGVILALAISQQYGLSPLLLLPAGLILGVVVSLQYWRFYGQIPNMRPGEYTARRGAMMAGMAIALAGLLLGVGVCSVLDLPTVWGALVGAVAGVVLAIRFSRMTSREIDREFGTKRDS